MTAISTAVAIVMTPLNFSLWGGILPETRAVLRDVALDPAEMLLLVLLLGLPLAAGMITAARWPKFAERARKPMKTFSLIVLGTFIAGALAANWRRFIDDIGSVAFAVLLHNALALATGYAAARLAGLTERDRRAVSIEVGIQNLALGLILIFSFFDGLGGMAIIAACGESGISFRA